MKWKKKLFVQTGISCGNNYVIQAVFRLTSDIFWLASQVVNLARRMDLDTLSFAAAVRSRLKQTIKTYKKYCNLSQKTIDKDREKQEQVFNGRCQKNKFLKIS